MAIDLYFSNRVEPLAEKLAANLADEMSRKSNKLQAPLIIVPNQNLAKWLKLTIARGQSILLNLDFAFLETGLWRMLQKLDREGAGSLRLDHTASAVVILKILQTLPSDESGSGMIGRYLQSPAAGQADDGAQRLWQLSQRLANLFLEYELHRPDMIERWQTSLAAGNAMERSQQEIYRKAGQLRKKMADASGIPILSLLELAQKVIANAPPASNGPSEATWVHVFGLSQISDFHLRLLGRLQLWYPIHLYALNPSREFWEDLQSPRERRWIQKQDAGRGFIAKQETLHGELIGEASNILLAAWGKPGKENIRRLCELTDYTFNACYAEPAADDSLLHRIQNTILTFTAEPNTPMPQDHSLQIFASPGIFREVETVFHNICYNLEKDDQLQLTDIAILVPEMSRYKPVFDGIFNRSPKAVAYNLVDSRADIESVFGQAVLKILDLAQGRFSRREVFELMLNPCFMNRWQISPAEINDWANWAENLHIFHGYDQSQKLAKGYGAGPFFTWKLALQRLRLARIMSLSEPGELAGRNFGGVEPFADMASGNVEVLEKFGLIVETLHDELSRLIQVQMTGSQWKNSLLAVWDALLRIPADLKGEAAVQRDLVLSLENLVFYDQIPGDGQGRHMNLGVVAEFIRSQLGAISGGQGDYLTRGVTICALHPMRPIPFQIVYVLGLEEGRFPGRADSSSLDLRLGQRHIGDVSLPERNCYLFLEMLLSVRRKLYISYVARDLQKDRTLQPCSVVNQLRRYVEEEILPPGEKFQIAQIPLKGSSAKYLEPGAVNGWSDVMVNFSPADRLVCLRASDKWNAFWGQASKTERARVARFLPDWWTGRSSNDSVELGPQTVTARHLANFLKDPTRQSIQRHLGLYEREAAIEELIQAEDEPFYSQFPLNYIIRTQSVRHWIETQLNADRLAGQDRLSVEDICNRLYERYQTQSRTPEGVFAELDKRTLTGQCSRMAETLSGILDQMRSSQVDFRTLVCGDPGEGDGSAGEFAGIKTCGPLRLTVPSPASSSGGQERLVELSCRLPWIWQDRHRKWHALILSGSAKPSKEPDKYLFEPLLAYLIGRLNDPCAAWFEDRRMTFHIAYEQTVRSFEYLFETDAIRRYLLHLVSDYLNPKEFHWLPFEALKQSTVKPHKMRQEEINDVLREQFAMELAEAFAAETNYLVRRLEPAISLRSLDIARQRFGLIFETIES